MSDYPFFIPQVVFFANSSLFWFKVANEHREFHNYLYGIIELTKNYKPTSKKGVILIHMIPYKQLSLADIFQDCQNKFNNDKPAFLSISMHQREDPVNTLYVLSCGL